MTRRIVRGLLVALIIAGGIGWQRPRVSAQSALPPCGIAMRVLVVSANATEADLPAITTALDYVGTPFDVFITDPINTNPLTLETTTCATSSSTETPARALYQGVILTTNTAAAGYAGMLAEYEKKFNIRQVTWYNGWPSPAEGFNYPTVASSDPTTTTLTDAWTDAHRDFHRVLVEACGSAWLLRFREVLSDQSERYRRLSVLEKPDRDVAQEHRRLAEAVLARDAERAVEYLAAHYRLTAQLCRLPRVH